MPMYAIEYYNQATSLRPYDCRMWTALATVYEGLQRIPNAIQAHTRALLGADRIQTPTILSKLAALHTTLSGGSTSKEAVAYHKRLLALGERVTGLGTGTGVQMETVELAASYLAIAEYEMRDVGEGEGEGRERGDWALAAQYLEKVASTHAPQRDKAEDLLRELRLKEARLAANI
ncbi:MAG: Anaphase-promoting complex subunit 23 [Tremellales sp. Tagirdzhanova-0007]|nr:MAG: Anaphase-promoting complex subunit 23 [Tremellales sp. Tagirdzhanova-0007]